MKPHQIMPQKIAVKMQIPSPPELCFQKFINNNFKNSVGVLIFFSAETDTNIHLENIHSHQLLMNYI